MTSGLDICTYARKERATDAKRRFSEPTLLQDESSEAQYVYDTLKDDFQQSRQEWGKPVLEVTYKLKLPSLVNPLRKLSQTAVIIFFPGRIPAASDVAQWIKSILGGCFVEGMYFASRRFYEVHLSDASYKQRLLEISPLFYGRQMVHAMPWSPNKDYQSLIRHHCPVWVEVANFPDYMREELPGLAASLGQVICPPRPMGNRNRFYILWDTDIPTPPSIAVEVEGLQLGKKYFELKWGVFAGACFACHKFGHLASECPTVLHQPPPNALPPQPRGKIDNLQAKAANTNAAKNAKPANQVHSLAGKGKDKGKEKMKESVGIDQDGFQKPKKVVVLKQHPLQSRQWDASSPSPGQTSASASAPVLQNWVGVLKKGIPICDSKDRENAMSFMGNEGMQPMQAEA